METHIRCTNSWVNPEQCCTIDCFLMCRSHSLTLLREKKPFIFLVGRYFTSKIRPPTPCWAYSLLFTGMTCTSFTTLLQFPQKLTVILQRLFHGSAVWTLSSTGVIALLLESCGWLVTSPVSRTSRNTALQRRGLLRLEWGGSANCR